MNPKTSELMNNRTPAWKHKNPLITFICFIAYHLGYYKYQILSTLVRVLSYIPIAIYVLLIIVKIFNLTIVVHKAGELWFTIPGK
jgi:hypothetical protein